MCTVCGCGEGESRIEGEPVAHQHEHAHTHEHSHQHDHAHSHANGETHAHPHTHAHSHEHLEHAHLHEQLHQPDAAHHHPHPHEHKHEQGRGHAHAHGHSHEHEHEHTDADAAHHYGLGAARAHAPGMTQARMVQIEQDILGKNNQYANANRGWLAQHGVLALNLVSSPGSGKTALLTRTLDALKGELPLAVIEGDQETSHDAQRIRATGTPAIQINTGKGCHLDAHQVGHAMQQLAPCDGSVLFIENVGNLVCPAAFDLGEAHKVAILSVTEGEDKPLKYPDMFHAADLLLINKIDLLPYLQFDMQQCIEYARRVKPGIQVLLVSASSGEGMEHWYDWIRTTRKARLIGHPALQTVMDDAGAADGK